MIKNTKIKIKMLVAITVAVCIITACCLRCGLDHVIIETRENKYTSNPFEDSTVWRESVEWGSPGNNTDTSKVNSIEQTSDISPTKNETFINKQITEDCNTENKSTTAKIANQVRKTPTEEKENNEPKAPTVTKTTSIADTTTITEKTTKKNTEVKYNNSVAVEEEMLKLVNEARVANGVAKLSRSSSLYEPALVRAYECSVKWSHTRPNGESMGTILGECGISNYSLVGENLVKEASNAQHAFDSLMNSPGHRENILDSDYTAMAIGSYIDENGVLYVSQIFIAER